VALRPRFLADKSALARMGHPRVREALEPLIITGDVARCAVVDLEILFSARNHREFVQVRDERDLAFPPVDTQQADFDRAVAVMERLAAKGHHRGVSLPDLLIAAVAERHGLTVLHYDADFDTVARVTGQPMRWVVAKGTV
jgi:predicted nucleic acid-binding protein